MSESSDKQKNTEQTELGRRQLLRGALATGIAAGIGSLSPPVTSAREGASTTPTTESSSRVVAENAKPGTTDWQLTFTRVDPETQYRSPWIEGYVSHTSVKAGDDLKLFVSTNPVERYRVSIYRLGYYGGKGGRLMAELGEFQGEVQPDPPVGEKRLRECRWKSATSIKIPSDWPSGVYLGKLSLVKGRYQSYVVFIVREDRPTDILFQCSDNTWQAYNRWPDNYSLYDADTGKKWNLLPGVKVGFDRPYGKYCQILDAPLSQGAGEFGLWEFPCAYWLEQHGYDVTYCSNSDVHADVLCPARGKVFLSVGHDEYWSLEQFQHVKAAVKYGTNVGFFSGNTCCFVTPFSKNGEGKSNRVITRAGRYGGVSEAEKNAMGPFPMEGPNEAMLIGARTTSPFNGSGDWIVSDAGHWIFKGTAMKNGDRIPGLVGWEFHGEPADLDGLKVIAEGTTVNGGGREAHWTATVYPGPNNNWVFNAATIFWAQGLSRPPGHIPPYSHFGRPHGPDERVQKITENFLAKCGVKPTTA